MLFVDHDNISEQVEDALYFLDRELRALDIRCCKLRTVMSELENLLINNQKMKDKVRAAATHGIKCQIESEKVNYVKETLDSLSNMHDRIVEGQKNKGA